MHPIIKFPYKAMQSLHPHFQIPNASSELANVFKINHLNNTKIIRQFSLKQIIDLDNIKEDHS